MIEQELKEKIARALAAAYWDDQDWRGDTTTKETYIEIRWKAFNREAGYVFEAISSYLSRG